MREIQSEGGDQEKQGRQRKGEEGTGKERLRERQRENKEH